MKRKGSTLFGLIRHAPTKWNEERIIQGQEDSPLSLLGKKTAASWSLQLRTFDWQRILCSDLGRVCETVALINHTLRLPVHRDARLREQNWGMWTGMTLAEIKRHHQPELRDQVHLGWLFTPPDGESRLEVLGRTRSALKDAHRNWPGESVLVVCHEGVIKCLLYHLLQRKFLPEEPRVIKSAHLHLLECNINGICLQRINALPLIAKHDEAISTN
ncbi:MAG: histidine phosphatase family protein [Desulfobulbales bacterium]